MLASVSAKALDEDWANSKLSAAVGSQTNDYLAFVPAPRPRPACTPPAKGDYNEQWSARRLSAPDKQGIFN